LFVALAIIPLIASSVLKRRSKTKFEQKQVAYAHQLEDWYRSHLANFLDDEFLQRKFLAGLFAALIFALSLPVNLFAGILAAPLVYIIGMKFSSFHAKNSLRSFGKGVARFGMIIITVGVTFFVVNLVLPSFSPVKVIFFEQSDVDFLIVELEKPEGTTKEVTDVAIRRVEEFLYDEPDIDSFTTTVGSGSQFGSGGNGEKFANIFINLNLDRDRTSTEIVDHLRAEMSVLNDLKVTVNQPSDGPPTGAAIIVKFLGDDLNEITRLANSAAVIFR
jgi:multidrug efflux pump subunit AcrB